MVTRITRVVGLLVVAVLFSAPIYSHLDGLDLENDEAIHSLVALSIVETGNWMTPQWNPDPGSEFVEKPPLKFWLVALPIKAGLVPDREAGLRLWDATFGALAFLYVYAIGCRLAGPLCGVLAAFVLFTFDPILLQHGFRTNNMDAAQVLAYCGGLYHFLRWTSASTTRAAWFDVTAMGLFFWLSFMTKFVAAAFLPIVIAVVLAMTPDAPARLLRQWRIWATVAAGVTVAASPWFLYQTFRMGTRFWQIILGEHVFKRFGTALDPAHIQPWSFYFVEIYHQMARAGTFWFVAAGAALILYRLVRKPWLEGALVVFWFSLPLSLISMGTSKLIHYAYPYVPALALAAGYFGATVYSSLVRAIVGPRPAWIERLLGGRLALSSSPTTGSTAARLAVRGALLAALVLCLPLRSYRAVGQELKSERHPFRTTRDCIASVRNYERNAGRKAPDMYVWVPTGFYQHPFYYYYRDIGYDRHEYWNDVGLTFILDAPGEQRPVLMPKAAYQAFYIRAERENVPHVPLADFDNVVLLLPGPFTGCTPK
jgi:hypothetical protein